MGVECSVRLRCDDRPRAKTRSLPIGNRRSVSPHTPCPSITSEVDPSFGRFRQGLDRYDTPCPFTVTVPLTVQYSDTLRSRPRSALSDPPHEGCEIASHKTRATGVETKPTRITTRQPVEKRSRSKTPYPFTSSYVVQ
eukprot:127239-Pyramimonas_sp.AAC.1